MKVVSLLLALVLVGCSSHHKATPDQVFTSAMAVQKLTTNTPAQDLRIGHEACQRLRSANGTPSAKGYAVVNWLSSQLSPSQYSSSDWNTDVLFLQTAAATLCKDQWAAAQAVPVR
jgi:hypothetical protein